MRPFCVMTPSSSKQRSALLLAFSLATLPACAASNNQSAACLSSEHRQEAILKYIVDGDTLVLTDDRKVRVLGINTPEIRPSPQPKALAAKQAAQALMPVNSKLWLHPGIEANDRHGRALAHVVTQSGTNLAEHLLTSGLAASSAVHPNTRCAEHYRQLESQARDNKLGLWNEPHPWQLVDKRISKKLSGFRLVTSTVKNIKTNSQYHHLQLANGLNISMTNKLANEIRANKLKDKRLTVRGWVQWRKNKPSLKLHHATNLQLHNE